MFKFFSRKLNGNTLPSDSQGGKPKKQLYFSLQGQLFCNVYSLILENAQSVFIISSLYFSCLIACNVDGSQAVSSLVEDFSVGIMLPEVMTLKGA